jgi:zinc protease
MGVFVLLALSATPQSPSDTETLSPFAGFETLFLDNDLKIWFKHLPGDPNVAISVALPFGADMDPPGKEQLAHFTEHMLFSDQPGLTEEEIRRQIEELGGVYNASVTSDRTFYYVHIGREHAEYAIEWLGRILQPHAMDPDVVERQREPVALEVGARPRQFFDWLWAYYLYPPALRTPGFWEREFGMKTRASRDYYPFASLNSIAPEDLRWFYETYYVPSLMTLTVIGDLDRRAVLGKVDEVFGTLEARPRPDAQQTLSDPGRYWQRIFWAYRSNIYYSNRFKFYNLSADDEVTLLFVAQLLGKRLNDKLRFGDRKATYGISVGVDKRGGGSYIHVTGGIKPEEFEFARGVVEADLATLRDGTLDVEEFAADKAAVVNQLRVTNSSSQALERWVRIYFFDPRSHHDFPDLVGVFERLSLDDVEEFLQDRFVPERQTLTVIRPFPITQGLLALSIVALIWLSLYAVRRRLVRPIDMTRLRYVARFRIPPLYLLAWFAFFTILSAIAGRLIFYVFQIATESFLVTLDSFILQWSAYAMMLVASIILVVMVLARIPRKLLVFDDEIRVKYLSYRSRLIRGDEVEEVTLRRFREVWLTPRLWRCLPLAIGLLTPAIYMKQRGGRAIFFRTRDTIQLFEVLRGEDQGSLGATGGQPSTPRPQA